MVRFQQVMVPKFMVLNRRVLDAVLPNTVRPTQEHWRKPATPYPSCDRAALYGNGCQYASQSLW
jgi:hypothetical protein